LQLLLELELGPKLILGLGTGLGHAPFGVEELFGLLLELVTSLEHGLLRRRVIAASRLGGGVRRGEPLLQRGAALALALAVGARLGQHLLRLGNPTLGLGLQLLTSGLLGLDYRLPPILEPA